MYKRVIPYTDFKGTERTETFMFNLSKAEITEMELGTTGGMGNKLEQIVSAQDTASLIQIFKELLLKAYGVVSDDGRRFIKTDALREEFAQTPAYDILFMELATDADKAAEFINQVIPADMAKQAKEAKLASANN